MEGDNVATVERLMQLYIGIALLVAVCANLTEGYLVWGLAGSVASLAPGTAIRPLGFALAAGATAMLAFLCGTLPALAGILLAWKRRESKWITLGAAALCLSLLPYPLCQVLEGHFVEPIIAARGLVHED